MTRFCFVRFIGFVSIIREKSAQPEGSLRTFNRPLSKLLLLQFHAKAVVRFCKVYIFNINIQIESSLVSGPFHQIKVLQFLSLSEKKRKEFIIIIVVAERLVDSNPFHSSSRVDQASSSGFGAFAPKSDVRFAWFGLRFEPK